MLKHKFQSVGKRYTPSRSVLLILESKCVCPLLNEPLDVHFEINLLIDGMNEQGKIACVRKRPTDSIHITIETIL
jgi:hypothetical protein